MYARILFFPQVSKFLITNAHTPQVGQSDICYLSVIDYLEQLLQFNGKSYCKLLNGCRKIRTEGVIRQ